MDPEQVKPEQVKNVSQEEAKQQTFTVRMPGFLLEEEVGLGDIIKHATASIGIRPCGGCEQRAAALNRHIRFSGTRPK